MSGRSGTALLELLVALTLTFVLLAGAATLLRVQARALDDLRARSAALQAERVIRTLLPREVGSGVVARDWHLPGEDRLSLRAFRGRLDPCLPARDGRAVTGVWHGLRDPDPAKDSALVLGGTRWVAAAIAAARRDPDGCGREGGWRIELEPAVPHAVVVRVFERGEYVLADGALRYRRGAGGRQPLTDRALHPEASGLEAGPAGYPLLRVEGRGGGWTRTLRGNGDP